MNRTPAPIPSWLATSAPMTTRAAEETPRSFDNFADYSPQEFQDFVGELFKKIGYEVEMGKYTQDFGIDLVARKEGEVVVVEVKKWEVGNNVGAEVVRGVLGAMWKATANKAVVVTTSDFTVLAEEQARGAPVELWNLEMLRKLAEKYFITEEMPKIQSVGEVKKEESSQPSVCPECGGSGRVQTTEYVREDGVVAPHVKFSPCPNCQKEKEKSDLGENRSDDSNS